jgi:hypothetical protein
MFRGAPFSTDGVYYTAPREREESEKMPVYHTNILRGRIVSTQTRSVTLKFNSSGEILLDKPTTDESTDSRRS